MRQHPIEPAYERYAAECVRVAQKTPNARDKAVLIEMAQKWRELARKLEGKGGEIPDDG